MTTLSTENIEALSVEEIRQVLHDLEVHQTELEMQNEALRRTQAELEATRERYCDLYDLAPVGYCTISEQGLILEGNLKTANLLGAPRADLAGQPLTRFILPEDQDIFYLHRNKRMNSGESCICELRIQTKDNAPFWVRLESNATHDIDGNG